MDIGECTKCNKWGEVPKSFNESKYFLQCPICKGPMYLMRKIQPKDIGLSERNKVEINGFIEHRG